MITEFERTVIDLRAMAQGLEPAGRYLLKMAADQMENQHRQLEAQRTIIKQQAIQCMSVSDELRKKEETIGHLSEVLAAARAERDVVAQRMIQLEQENAKLQSERDALLQIVREYAECEQCRHETMPLPCNSETLEFGECESCSHEKTVCCGCSGANWEWRGLMEGK